MLIILYIVMSVSLLLFIHPYVTYPLSLMLFRERPLRLGSGSRPATASMLFCAYNEERSLPSKIDNLRQIKALDGSVQMLAYSDFSTDGTLALLQSEGDLLTAIGGTTRTGKALGMRRLASSADGDILIFTDANVLLEPNAIERLLTYFSDPTVGGVAGSLVYINPDESTTAMVGSAYWQLEESIKRLESRCGSIMGADGSIFATRRSLYPEVPGHLLDDFIVSISVTFAGYRLIHAGDVVAYERGATVSADEFRRKRRIACRAFNTHRHLWSTIRQTFGVGDLYKYLSHKLLRWFGLVPLTIGAASMAAALSLMGLSWLALILGLAAVGGFWLGRLGVPGLGAGAELLLSILATFLGIIDSLRGKTYQTWAPALSRA